MSSPTIIYIQVLRAVKSHRIQHVFISFLSHTMSHPGLGRPRSKIRCGYLDIWSKTNQSEYFACLYPTSHGHGLSRYHKVCLFGNSPVGQIDLIIRESPGKERAEDPKVATSSKEVDASQKEVQGDSDVDSSTRIPTHPDSTSTILLAPNITPGMPLI